MQKHYARKRFGQNFLVDDNIIHNIITAIAPKTNDRCVEIGPGQGAITWRLLEHLDHLTVIELDRDLAAMLAAKQNNKLTIIEANALKFDFSSLGAEKHSLRIVGNLPYNISTPLLFHLLESSELIKDMHFMLQKEVVERMVAKPGNKDYGRLSVMLQYRCQIDHLFNVSPECFKPKPKVESAIVRLVPHATIATPVNDLNRLQHIVTTAFSQRRKTLRKALSGIVTAEQLATLNIDSSLRPDQLAVSDYVNIANAS